MRLRWMLLAPMTVVAAYAAQACGGHGDAQTMVVATAWLGAHINDPNLVILAIGDNADYDRGHIPGALSVARQDIANRLSPLTLELPPIDDLVSAFEKLGVSNDSRIILYVSKDRITETSRVFLTLDSMGLGRQTALLDGGLPAWQTEGRAVSKEVRAVKRGNITPCPQSDVIVDADYIKSNLRHKGIAVVDARLPEYFTGASAGMGKRAGHIPGATNLPFSTLVDDQGKLWPAGRLRELFDHAGIHSADRVVSYCHIGQQATLVYFVARYLGHDARLYDGSWEDWSAHAERPAETSANRQ